MVLLEVYSLIIFGWVKNTRLLEKISSYIKNIPEGKSKTPKEMRIDLALEEVANNTCLVTTDIFLRQQ